MPPRRLNIMRRTLHCSRLALCLHPTPASNFILHVYPTDCKPLMLTGGIYLKSPAIQRAPSPMLIQQEEAPASLQGLPPLQEG